MIKNLALIFFLALSSILSAQNLSVVVDIQLDTPSL